MSFYELRKVKLGLLLEYWSPVPFLWLTLPVIALVQRLDVLLCSNVNDLFGSRANFVKFAEWEEAAVKTTLNAYSMNSSVSPRHGSCQNLSRNLCQCEIVEPLISFSQNRTGGLSLMNHAPMRSHDESACQNWNLSIFERRISEKSQSHWPSAIKGESKSVRKALWRIAPPMSVVALCPLHIHWSGISFTLVTNVAVTDQANTLSSPDFEEMPSVMLITFLVRFSGLGRCACS